MESTNYSRAKANADRVDEIIISTLQEGQSFRVEAGAGSGKTYSLKKVIEWIQANKLSYYQRKRQNVICITYTNAAVDVISERLPKNSFIIPSTIHSFAWNAIKQYQGELLNIISRDSNFQTDEGDFTKVTEIRYTLGHRYIENGVQYLYHDDVLNLFCTLLDNRKFRNFFSNKYPLILIDEYQDTYKPIIDLFIKYFISNNEGPQFGFFGDAWQTIYQSNKACGQITHENLVVINKGANFRSAPRIVQALNKIRPELPQLSAVDGFEGEVIVVSCDDYSGIRRNDRIFKDDLPVDELRDRLNGLINHLKSIIPDTENVKTLMITHKVLASQQGYRRLLEILNDGLRDKQDIFLLFFMNTVEPIYKAIQTSNMQLLFDTLGIKRYPITKRSEKEKWKQLEHDLIDAREKRCIDVLETVISSGLVPIPPDIESYYEMYYTAPDLSYSGASLKDFFELEYTQFLAAIDFLYPDAEFSTEHGVKGEEYDNVIFVIGRGWNQYQFEYYAPMITGTTSIPEEKEASFVRNRNLFYVCCSRPRKRLILFITIPLNPEFKSFLSDFVGGDNIFTYSQYLKC